MCKWCTVIFLLVQLYLIATIAYGRTHGYRSCGYELSVLWSTEVSQSPFAATPLIADVDGDGTPDVVAAPFTEEVQVLKGEDGSILPDSNWPFHLADRTILASPLQYDINQDGKLDIVITTTDGELLFFTGLGDLLSNSSYKLEPLFVNKKWFTKVMSLDKPQIHDYILDKPPTPQQRESHIAVDPHVLASPVIADLNNDGLTEEMLIPVSYYFEGKPVSINIDELDKEDNSSSIYLHNYLSGAVLVLNLTSLQPIKVFHLELTKKIAEYPGYVLFTPTVIDLDGNSGLPEIIVGTSAGNLHVFNVDGKVRAGFPRAFDTLHGQITAADVNMDGELELVVMDTSGNVMCIDGSGKTVWEASISGTSSAGSRVADLDGDGQMEVIIATNDGNIWALKGKDGKIEPEWPLRVGKKVTSNVLIVRISIGKLVLITLSDDGHLHLLSGSKRCRQTFGIGETSLAQVLSYDLVSQSDGLELLVATKDGSLICLAVSVNDHSLQQSLDSSEHAMYSWPQETKGYNGFTYSDGKTGVAFTEEMRTHQDFVGGTYPVSFLVMDSQPQQTYRVQLLFGNILIGNDTYDSPGRWVINVRSPHHPAEGHLTVIMKNQYGQVFSDTISVRFNKSFLRELQWLLCVPFIAMVMILLLVHGFPTADLLPTTQRSKVR